MKKAAFQNSYDRDEYTALYYGLDKALKVGGFNKKDLNIILLLGNYGDFKLNKARRLQAQQSGSRALITDTEPLIEALNSIEAHFYSIQLNNDGSRTARTFSSISQYLILETAKYAFNTTYGSPNGKKMLEKVFKKTGVKVGSPRMELIEDHQRIPLEGARISGALHRPQPGKFFSLSEVRKAMISEISSSTELMADLQKVVTSIVNGNPIEESMPIDNPRAAGRLTPAFASWLYGILQDRNVSCR